MGLPNTRKHPPEAFQAPERPRNQSFQSLNHTTPPRLPKWNQRPYSTLGALQADASGFRPVSHRSRATRRRTSWSSRKPRAAGTRSRDDCSGGVPENLGVAPDLPPGTWVCLQGILYNSRLPGLLCCKSQWKTSCYLPLQTPKMIPNIAQYVLWIPPYFVWDHEIWVKQPGYGISNNTCKDCPPSQSLVRRACLAIVFVSCVFIAFGVQKGGL